MKRSGPFAICWIIVAAACGDSSGPAIVSVTSVSPDRGPLAGGTTVTITGANFQDITRAAVGGVALLNVTAQSSTQITGVTPPGLATGAQEVVVTSSSRGNAHCAACFTYTQFPGPLQLRVIMNQDSSPPLGALLVQIEGGPVSAVLATGPVVAWSYTATNPAYLIVRGDLGIGSFLATIAVADTQESVRSRYHATVRQASARGTAGYAQLSAANYFVSILPVQ